MWQIISKPDILIYLQASFQTSTTRRKLDWQEKDYNEQIRRLAHARQHAHIVIPTDDLSAEDVLVNALESLDNIIS